MATKTAFDFTVQNEGSSTDDELCEQYRQHHENTVLEVR